MLENGWSEATGGFSGRPAGTAAPIAFPPGAFVSSQDQRGLAITVKPNEVAFVQTLFPLNTAGFPLLMRLTVRANAPEASIALAALRGNLNDMNGVDGSIATHVPASAASFMALERRIVLVYEPDSGELITPLIQVAATGQTGNVVVFVDKLEVLILDPLEFGSNLTSSPDPTPTPTATPAAPQTITIDLPTLPADAKPLEMVLIPAGTFVMGSPDSEQDRYSEEGPQHQVTLTKPFYLGKYEVTQAQWQAVMGSNPSHFQGDNLPVEMVSWNDCQTFIQQLNQLGQGTFRLPTEAEWECACRAGTTWRFSHGNVLECGDECESCTAHDLFMWWCGNSGNHTHEVGSKLPNPWGLYDMHGNVWELCNDW
ncbi:MAG TPA: formylglycine-generating enzyme family protein, partial [bacterium]|nr:formylglycine-generating enzyme family protein [bacterium]